MSDTDRGPVDLDTLTDDQVMNLTPDEIDGLGSQENGDGDEQLETGADDAPDDGAEDNAADGSPDSDEEESADEQPDESEDDEDGDQKAAAEDEPQGENTSESADESSAPESADKVEKPKEPDAGEKKPTTKELKAAEAAQSTTENAVAVDFYKKVSAPFKANGKEMQVRSAEDVVRLMQMGIDYSRNMQLMKPMKAMDAMLKTHGLNDPAKISYLIDVKNGKPEAIMKLLKDNNIDPLDLNTADDAPIYRQSNYQQDPKDQDFQEAIDNTMARPGGRELIADVNAMWDDKSKEALREEPAIFDNLLAQKDSGVYEQVKTELEYQRSLNFLTNVPFLQAYHQVSQAMEKAGVFAPKIQEGQAAPAPLATGSRRKAASKPKTVQPNPPSSASQPRTVPSNGTSQNEPDYSSMTDAEFMKLGEPT